MKTSRTDLDSAPVNRQTAHREFVTESIAAGDTLPFNARLQILESAPSPDEDGYKTDLPAPSIESFVAESEGINRGPRHTR
jgi:hypothetical protein